MFYFPLLWRMKIAVTGATGHIGSAVCRELVKRGYEVKALMRSDMRAIANLDITHVKGDILSRESLIKLMEDCDGVVHTAGLIRLGYKYDKEVYDINVTGTKNVFDVAISRKVKRIVHLSSIHAYRQQPLNASLDESRQLVAERSIFYDQTKRTAHLLAQKMAAEGHDVVIIAPTSVLGPPDFKPSKIGKAVVDIYKGSVPAAVKGGFDFVDVRDAAAGIVSALEKGKPGASYLMGGKYHTIKDLADTVLEVKGVKKRLAELPLLAAYVGLPFIKSYAALAHKAPLYDKVYLDILQDANRHIVSEMARQELGFTARPLKETIADLIGWFKKTGKI